MATSENPTQRLVHKLREDLNRVLEDARHLELTPRGRTALSEQIQRSATALNVLLAEIDPVDRPNTIFDPGNPLTVGFFVALALTAQPRRALSDIKSFYGAGIYAIYYSGSFDAYKLISGTETPIYVGMALQGTQSKEVPTAKSTPLAARLNEHRKNIVRASATLDLTDFSYRSLVIQGGWESPSENYLINMFRPLWNRETGILYGFGKHGDSSDTRKNKRSPWDTLHSGRKWAAGDHQQDAKSPVEIAAAVTEHFRKTKIYNSFDEVLQSFVADLKQR